jgi:CheY-like chemotaxis protein
LDLPIRKILVVDDDADTRCNLADLFSEFGYSIDTAEAGDIALEQAGRQRYGVALLDLRMPGMNGLTLCRRLKRMQPSMVAMMITAYAGGLEEDAHEAGAQRVLPKPIDFPALLHLVENALVQPN